MRVKWLRQRYLAQNKARYFTVLIAVWCGGQKIGFGTCTSELALTYSDERGRFGYKDKQDQWWIAPVYKDARPFCDGIAATRRDNEKWGYINKWGVAVIAAGFDEATDFSEGAAGVVVEAQAGFVDKTGHWMCAFKGRHLSSLSHGRAVAFGLDARGNVAAGYVDRDCHWVVPPKFDNAKSYVSGLGPIKISGMWGFIDLVGTPVISALYSAFFAPSENAIGVKNGNAAFYINFQGDRLINESFDDALPFSHGIAAVIKKGQAGYINATGSWIVMPSLCRAQSFQSGPGGISAIAQGYFGGSSPDTRCIDARFRMNQTGDVLSYLHYDTAPPRCCENPTYCCGDAFLERATAFEDWQS